MAQLDEVQEKMLINTAIQAINELSVRDEALTVKIPACGYRDVQRGEDYQVQIIVTRVYTDFMKY